MSTITAILEADADGTLHLPLPAEWRHGKMQVTVTLEPVPVETLATRETTPSPVPIPGSLKGFWISPDFDAPLDDFKEYME